MGFWRGKTWLSSSARLHFQEELTLGTEKRERGLTQPRKRSIVVPVADIQKAEQHADFAIDIGELREDKREGYVRGWLNRGFYRC